MSSHPRRSARLSPHLQPDQHQPRSGNPSAVTFANNYSQPSSASTSSHPSPISDGLHPPPPPPTPQQAQPHLHLPSHLMSGQQQQQQSHLYAPLPSPSAAADMPPFFARPHSQPNPYASQQVHLSYQNQLRQQQAFSEQQHQAAQQNQQHQLHPHTNSMSEDHPARAHTVNPGQLPPDFLAEAAKRAQMACLMRDFGDVSL